MRVGLPRRAHRRSTQQECFMAKQPGRARRADDDAPIPLKRRRRRPDREAAEAAVRTLIEWAGDDPAREGLRGTPDRVVRSYQQFFPAYQPDPFELLHRTSAQL